MSKVVERLGWRNPGGRVWGEWMDNYSDLKILSNFGWRKAVLTWSFDKCRVFMEFRKGNQVATRYKFPKKARLSWKREKKVKQAEETRVNWLACPIHNNSPPVKPAGRDARRASGMDSLANRLTASPLQRGLFALWTWFASPVNSKTRKLPDFSNFTNLKNQKIPGLIIWFSHE